MTIPFNSLRELMLQREKEALSPLATFSNMAKRRSKGAGRDLDYRQPFSIDGDRILHSLAYARYIDKTQVFSLVKNDHITHRSLHVQLVSKIARTIGRFLRLNEDLIEAISLGHDIGHPPFGHEGEKYLSELCQKYGAGLFFHNVQSVRFLDKVERKGKGWNLCLQTLDGILCHDGEIHDRKLMPLKKNSFDDLDNDMAKKTANCACSFIPMTLEACVVRFSDTIGYIGRDMEDAIRLGLIKRSDIPEKCAKVLGKTNGTIVHSLVTDVINTSYDKNYIAFSHEISNALKSLKKFNYERIYLNPKIKKHSQAVKKLFTILFGQYMEDLEKENRKSVIFTYFLSDMAESYRFSHKKAEIVRDFIAGMTDNYFLRQCPENMRPSYYLY